jgi:precorrin-6Y C5,15-methyltransferase (decarboxylating)
VAVAPRLARLVEGSCTSSARRLLLGGDVEGAVEEIARLRDAGEHVVVVASGDPGYFGLGRALAARLGREGVLTRPAASSPAVAFGLVGLPWDDAVVVSAHGRPLEAAVDCLRAVEKAAVLCAPHSPPERIGAALLEVAHVAENVAVCSELGTTDQAVQLGDLAWLAKGKFPPRSVVLLWNGSGVSPRAALSSPAHRSSWPVGFGRPESEFESRGGMITKGEVRAICLSRLQLPRTGVLWDVGAGSGSVGIEAALLEPGLQVVSVERDAEAADRVRRNAARLGASLRVVEGEAPGCLSELPDPDRAFVGGGGLGVLGEVLRRLRAEGKIVASFTSLERAGRAASILGGLVEISVSRGSRMGDGTFRLASLDPVFVCFGPLSA